MPQPYAILWDLDATLLDTADLHYRAWLQVVTPYHIPFSHARFLSTFGMNNAGVIPTLFDHPSPQFIAEFALRKENALRLLARQEGVRLHDGVDEWLKRFRAWGFPQAVASSAPEENVQTLVDAAGIRLYFSLLRSGDGIPSKPDPYLFLNVAQTLGFPPARCLVIEDSPAGLLAARRAGMFSLAVETTHSPADLKDAGRVVRRLSDFSVDDMQLFLNLI